VSEDSPNGAKKPAVISAADVLSRTLRSVLREQAKAREDLATRPIHDLRVALRRSRSLAEAFSDVDPNPEWRRLAKACRRLQRDLARLRDVQVVLQWVEKLHLDSAADGAQLCELLEREERRARRRARETLRDFPRKRWKAWKRRLPRRAESLSLGEPQFAFLALRRLEDVRESERRRRRSRSRKAAHNVRIALKRFRYTVESLMPAHYDAWAMALKALQRSLGEVHDLDVLRAAIIGFVRGRKLPEASQKRWLAPIEEARAGRIAAYERRIVRGRRKLRPGMTRAFLWDRWRADLRACATVSLPDSAGSSLSSARRAPHGREKSSRRADRPRRLSSVR
jgi:CHAD domain-containing protein